MRSRNNDRTLTVASIASIAAFVVLVVLLAIAARDADAQPPRRHAVHAAATPAIGADSARAIALARVRGATVTSERLRARHGHELYLFTLAVAGQKSPVRATVDAASGAFTRLDGAATPTATMPASAKPAPPATAATTRAPATKTPATKAPTSKRPPVARSAAHAPRSR